MKTKNLSAILLAGLMTIGFCQCTQTTQAPAPQTTVVEGIKIAYIDVDTLLMNYDFYTDLSEAFLTKQENSQLRITEEANKFQKDYEDFQKKLQNNVFSSQARAEQEANRLQKKQDDLQQLNDRLSQELAVEQNLNNAKINDSIQSFLHDFNKEKGYSIILNSASALLIEPSMNITWEVIEGLNARYNGGK